MVPYEKNDIFVGRGDTLDDIFQRLCKKKPLQHNHRIALYGLGGVGKTQTALAYIHARKEYYNSIFWISGVSHVTLLSGYQEIASTTNCVKGLVESNPSKIAKKVLDWLQQQTNWIDNLDDVTVIEGLLPST